MFQFSRRRRALTRVAVGVSVGLVAALSVAGVGGAAGPAGPAARPFRGGPHKPASSLLVDHGGKVLAASKTYAIWWGPAAGFPVDAQTGLGQLLGGLNGTPYLATATQYLRGGGVTTAFAGSFSDPSAPPRTPPQVSTIVAEVAKVLGSQAPEANAVYIVYTSNFPHLNYCAWHAAGTISGVTVQVAYLPNTAGVAGCDPGDQYDGTGYTEGTRSLADSTAHELLEAITDPVPTSGWADKTGQEIADKCNFVYGGPVTLSDHSVWQLQEQWSNAAAGCVQTTP